MSIAFEKVAFVYGAGSSSERAALRQISLTIEDGEFVCIMGRTGCGKTTLVQLAAGLLTPTGGRILLDGRDINSAEYPREELRRRIGVVFQYPEYQLFETSVEKDVAFGLKHLPLSKEEKSLRVRQAVETMGFTYEEIRHQSPLSLSGGEKRRIAVAGILAIRPSILILDEPVAGLDPPARTAFLETLRKLHQKGVTILMVTHDPDVAAEYAQRILILKDAELVQDGTPEAVFACPEELEAFHLTVSGPRRITELLRQNGADVPQDIIRYQELRSMLLAALSSEGGKS